MNNVLLIWNATVPWKLPNFTPELLWNLGYVFFLLTLVLFFGIFLVRRERLRQQHDHFVGRQELLPMIEDFLYYRHNDSQAADMEYVRMKISLRELVKIPAKRKLVSQILMELRKDVSGTPRARLQNLYMDLGLHSDAFKKLQSRRWSKVAKGIEELMDMQVALAYYIVKKYINHGNSVVRKQAQLAIVSLRDEGLEYFMDMASGPVSAWQQMGIMEVLSRKEDYSPPFLAKWLRSTNQDILLLALRLISAYKQQESARQVYPLLAHPTREIRMAALECIGKCKPVTAKPHLMEALQHPATVEEKVQILDALEPLLDATDTPWLEAHMEHEPATVVKNKLRSLKEVLRQGLPEEKGTVTAAPVPRAHPSHQPPMALPGEEGQGTAAPAPRALPAHQPPIALPSPSVSPGGSQKDVAAPSNPAGDLADSDLDISPLLPPIAPDFTLVAFKQALRPNAADPEASTGADQANPGDAYPKEGWSAEEALVFDHCVEEAWEELLTAYLNVMHSKPNDSGSPSDGGKTKNNPMKPFESTPEWLAKIEVTGEELTPGNGYTGLLEEILLRDLEENALVFKTDFIPRIVEEEKASADPGRVPEEGEGNPPAPIPEFVVDAAAIEQIPADPETQPGTTEPVPDSAGDEASFSILEEYFRHYDNESKVIMLEEIPEIGEEKDLAFLAKLFGDPDKKVRAGAKKAHALLRKRLQLKEEPSDAPGFWENRTLADPGQAPDQSDFNGDEAEIQLDFFPDFEEDQGETLATDEVREDKSINGYLDRPRYSRTRRNKTIDG